MSIKFDLWNHRSHKENSIYQKSVVEILDDSRVLIENHMGIREYDRNNIAINVKIGWIDVSGKNLELRQMTKEQLVISGEVLRISICRRR